LYNENSFNFHIIYFLLFGHLKVNAQYPTDYTFESYKIKEGLSEGGTHTIFQDHLGYIWVGTIGLERFDGYVFKNYRSSVFDSSSIPSGAKNVIKEDQFKNLWVCTENNISKYKRSTDTWDSYSNEKIQSTFNDYFFSSNLNEIYITTAGDGLILFNPLNKTWKQYQFGSNRFTKIASISKNELLIATSDGVIIFNTGIKKFTQKFFNSTSPGSQIRFNDITKKDDTHWFVSSTRGIWEYSKQDGLVPAFQYQKGMKIL